jgi:hypothetical protein
VADVVRVRRPDREAGPTPAVRLTDPYSPYNPDCEPTGAPDTVSTALSEPRSLRPVAAAGRVSRVAVQASTTGLSGSFMGVSGGLRKISDDTGELVSPDRARVRGETATQEDVAG